jgi:hypothetical protein
LITKTFELSKFIGFRARKFSGGEPAKNFDSVCGLEDSREIVKLFKPEV